MIILVSQNSQCNKLRKKLITWANKKYLPLVEENKLLKMENELLAYSLNQEKIKVEQHDFERARFREMAQRYQEENKKLRKIIERNKYD